MAAVTSFHPNELVDITIKGVRVFDVDRAGCVGIEAELPGTTIPGYYKMPPQAAITRVAPPNWPPQQGDQWRDRHGDLWDALYRHDEAPFIELEPADGRRGTPLVDRNEWVRRELGPLTLVHRKQQDGGQSHG